MYNEYLTLPAYAELFCQSNFSFLSGASHPEELVRQAAQLSYRAIALTDECSVAGVVRAHQVAKEVGIALIIGSFLRLEEGIEVVLLAADRNGYGNLSELITRGRRSARKGEYRLTCADFGEGLEGCLAIWLAGRSSNSWQGRWLARRFKERLWIGLVLSRGPEDVETLIRGKALAQYLRVPMVACGHVLMHTHQRRAVLDIVYAIRHGCQVAELGRRRPANGEQHLRSITTLRQIYPREMLDETLQLAARCKFQLDTLRYEYPREVAPAGEPAGMYLRRLVEMGMIKRWPAGAPQRARVLVEHELTLISELNYEPYFLTVYDIVRFARSRGILCQGRGSAANSAVCFCLGITEVDPGRMEMLFERFISKERNEPPDIDVDFEHERREEVIQYLYGRYGRDRAALAATVITYRPRSAVRDIGKALGMGLDQVDRLARSLAWWDGHRVLPNRMREIGVDPDSPVVRQLVAALDLIVGFPRHLSQHVGGFVIAAGALCRLVPIENATMNDRTVIQWDKDDLEALGLLKVDVLALGMLSAIRKAFDLIHGFRGTRHTMANVPAEDPAVYDMVCNADTVGVFQIESRAQMAMLPRLAPRTFYDLVIEVAIVRPGPIQGGMVHPYLRRRQGLEPVTYPSEAVRGVLERTLGIPIFQEQVMQLAVVAAGFTPGEADQLRRAMSAWRRKGGLGPFESKLVEGMGARGYSEDFARQIFAQIQGFGEYGFPESHSSSFALLVYVSCWLKCHEPAAFTGALLNSQPMGFYAPAQLVADARRHGVEVRPADVLYSEWDSTLEPGKSGEPALRLGLRMIKGLVQAEAEQLIQHRHHCLAPSEVTAGLRRATVHRLAAAGALESVAGHRHQAQWQALGVDHLPPVLSGARFNENLPELLQPSEADNVVADYASTGLSLRAHPMKLLRPRFQSLRTRTAADIEGIAHRRFVRTAGMVINRQRPGTASGVIFMTLEDETGFINLVVWPWVVERQRSEVMNAKLLLVQGVVEREGQVVHLIAGKLKDYSHWLGRLDVRSRDFH
jgi:error-prone DNA polymerase